MKEFDFINKVIDSVKPHPKMILGPGDDTALIKNSEQEGSLITVDMLLDGTHFELAKTDPYLIGHKAMAVNISDIAAMGGTPYACVISVALSKGDNIQLERIYQGIQDICSKFNIALAGGDTNSWNGPFAISVTLLGEPHPKGAIKRSGAKVGDIVYVTGALGDSLKGGHLDFTPRVEEAKILMDKYNIHAMIDISDGLASDLNHICDQSKVGVHLVGEQIPQTPSLASLPDKDQALKKALTDGEDFELCFTVDEETSRLIEKECPLKIPLTRVGRCVSESGIYLSTNGQKMTRLDIKGFEHSF